MKKQSLAVILVLATAMFLQSCSGGGNPGGSPSSGIGTLFSKTAIISGTVSVSSSAAGSLGAKRYTYSAAKRNSRMSRTLSTAGIKKAVELPPLINATMKLYNADRPKWIYPVAQVFTDSMGRFKLDTLSNADLNLEDDGSPAYKNGDAIPAGNYTIIATNDTTISGGKQLVAVQAFVKYFEGAAQGNDLVVQDSDARPSVAFMIGRKANSNGTTFGGAGATLAPNAGIQIIFDMAMARLSVIDAIKVYKTSDMTTAIAGTWKFTPDLLTATFYPSGGLTVSTDYTVVVQGGLSNVHAAVNVYGKPIPATVSCTFTSEAANDTTPPQNLILYKPTQTNVAITTPIQIASPEPIDINTIAVTSSPSIGDKPTVQYIGTKAVLLGQPDYYIYEIGHTPLLLNADYSITISDVRDMAGNTISPLTFTFKTEATSSGVTTTAGAEQNSQIAVKDVFGKWVNAMNARNAALLTTYMTGNFYWLPSGWSSDDDNHDGRLSLNEFRSMLEKSFDTFEHCGTVVSGDTSDITINGGSASITFSLTFTSTQNLTDPECATMNETKYAELENINSAWLISKGSDYQTSTYPQPLGLIELQTPANGTTFAEPTPSKPLTPDFVWTAVTGVQTYALLIMEKGATDTGYVALVDAAGYDNGDQVTFTFTSTTGYSGTSYVMPSGSLFGFTKGITKYLPDGQYVWSVLGFKTATVADFEQGNIAEPAIDLGASSTPNNFSVANNAPPSVLNVEPANSADHVTTSPTLTVVFSEAMDAASINATNFTLAEQEGNAVAGTITYDSSNYTATFVPTATLKYETTYVATLTTAVQDSAANSLAVEYSWSFTTADAPDTTAPVTSANPAGGTYNTTINVALTANETVQYILYSTDNSSPTVTYTSPIQMTSNTTLKFFAVDSAGNQESVNTETYVIDSVKPITDASPKGGYYNSKPVVVTLTTESGSSIYYTTDGSEPTKALTAYPTTVTTSLTGTGANTLRFFAVDAAGNAEGLQTETYIIDEQEPETFITSNPPNPTTLPNANFTFSSDETSATFQCSMDGAGFASCTSPYSVAVSEATHTFEVRAIDQAGNVDSTPASYTWTRDITPPTGSIVINSSATYATSPTVTLDFTSSDNLTGVDRMQLSNDGQAWYDPEEIVSTKQWTLSPGDGLKAVFVRFKDKMGNLSAPINDTITLDTTDPDTIIDSAPNDPSTNLNGKIYFSASETAAQFACRLYNETDAVEALGWATCTSGAYPPDSTLIDSKRFTVYVQATDLAGRVDSTPASYSWSVDTTALTTIAAPVGGLFNADKSVALTATGVGSGCTAAITYCTGSACTPGTPYGSAINITAASGTKTTTYLRFHAVESGTCSNQENEVVREETYVIDKQAPTVTITSAPPTSTNVKSASFYFSASETSTFECRLDSGAYAGCTSPMTYTGLADLTHTFYVRAKDQAGNTGVDATYTWTVDTTAPSGTVSMTDYYSGSASYVTNTYRYAKLAFSTAASDVAYVMISNDNTNYYYYTWSSLSIDGSGYKYLVWTLPSGEGNKTIYVKFRDTLGNESSLPTSDVIYLDTTPPDTTIYSAPGSPTSSRTVYFYFYASEAATFECSVDGGTYQSCTNPNQVSMLYDGTHTFSVRAKDNSGQYDPTPASYTWTLSTGYFDSTGWWDYSSWGN